MSIDDGDDKTDKECLVLLARRLGVGLLTVVQKQEGVRDDYHVNWWNQIEPDGEGGIRDQR